MIFPKRGSRKKRERIAVAMSGGVDSSLAASLLLKEGYDPKFGARPLRRAIQRLIENPLSNEMLKGTFKEDDTIEATLKDNTIVFEKAKKAK